VVAAAWSDATAYVPGDMVSIDGASWVCVLANTALRPFPPDYREAMLVTTPFGYWRLGEADGTIDVVVTSTTVSVTVKTASGHPVQDAWVYLFVMSPYGYVVSGSTDVSGVCTLTVADTTGLSAYLQPRADAPGYPDQWINNSGGQVVSGMVPLFCGTVVDEMGANDGTYVGAPTLGVAGLLAGDSDTAMTVANASQYITTPLTLPAGPFSVAIWQDPTQSANDVMFSLGNSLLWHSYGQVSIFDGSVTLLSDGFTLDPAMYVIVFDGTEWTVYRNGVGAAPVAKGAPVGSNFAIGANGYSALGTSDDPAIWDRAVTPAEIAGLNAVGTGTVYWERVTPLRDSLWVAEDLVPGWTPGVAQTWTQNVSAFGADVNDPADWSVGAGGQGIQTAWLKCVAPYRMRIALDASASTAATVLAVWSWDGGTGYGQINLSTTGLLAVTLAPGTYLVGVSQQAAGSATVTLDATFAEARNNLLLLGVGIDARPIWKLSDPFDLGGPGTLLLATPFDVEYLPLPSSYLTTPFDLSGRVRSAVSLPFDFGTKARWYLTLSFDLIASAPVPVVGVIPTPLPLPPSATPVTTTLTGSLSTTIGSPSVVGTGTLFLTQLIPGQQINIPGASLYTIASITDNTHLTLTASAGGTVSGVVAAGGAFLPGFAIYDKAGLYLGSVSLWETAAARSVALGQAGNLQFTLPTRREIEVSNDADLDLIQLDRIIVAGNNLGSDPWGGSISGREWANGRLAVTVDDVFAFVTGIEVGDPSASVDETQTPNPADAYAVAQYARRIILRTGDAATSAVAQVIAQVNQFRAAAGEVLWELDATGANAFFGDENVSGDAISALGLIAERSFSEFGWRIRVDQGRMTPILVWRDHFTAPAGVDFTDGPDGNVSTGVLYRESSQTIVNAMRLTGSVTSIQSKIPDGAQALPVQERIPVAEVWLDPGPYRRRTNLGQTAGIKVYVTVPFSFPPETQQGLADDSAAKMMKMFEKYLAAVHEQLGQPYHSEGFNSTSGWSWAGPGESIPEGYATFGERYLVLGDWIHRRYLATGPRSVVMVNKADSSHVRVSYDRLTGTALVARASSTPKEDPTVVYPFERHYIKNWDPRRDGIGVLAIVDVIEGEMEYTGATRWRIVSWGQSDQSWSTQLGDPARGLSATDTTTVLASTLGAPNPPFYADIGGYETVQVTAIIGATVTMVRGQQGTTADIHEPGESFTYNPPTTDGTVEKQPVDPVDQLPPLRVPWPEGEAFARRLLAKISRPQRVISMPVVNRNGDWATIAIGSTHAINVHAEGPTSGIVIGTGRVIAMAPDEVKGTMEVVCEVDLP
jgi:hypothetical protein